MSYSLRQYTSPSFAIFLLGMLSLCEAFSACTRRLCISSFDQLRLSDRIGSKSYICIFDLGSPRIAPNVAVLMTSNISECNFCFFFFEVSVVLRIILVSIFTDIFYDAFIQHRQVCNDGVDSVCQKFVLVSRTSEFSTLLFVQIFNEFYN